jgi:hypothetical protein
MPFRVKLHYDNRPGFRRPYLWVWYEGSSIQDDFGPTGEDSFGFVYDCSLGRQEFRFKFKEGSGTAGPLGSSWSGAPLPATRETRRQPRS